jgi:hypothetical protein
LASLQKVNVAHKRSLFSEHWNSKLVGEMNSQHVKLVKLRGEFVWHHHDEEDELFLVVKERFRMKFRNRSVWIEEGVCRNAVRGRGQADRRVAGQRAAIRAGDDAEYRQHKGRDDSG